MIKCVYAYMYVYASNNMIQLVSDINVMDVNGC